MPRVSRQQADKNRASIEEVSARLFKQHGLNGVSVADLMAAAGLTHGGFYGHFSSKDELAAVACAKGFEQSAERWAQRIAKEKTPRNAFKSIVDGYLSVRNRDDPGRSCAAMALATDVAREPKDKPVHAAYVAGLKQLSACLESLADADEEDAAQRTWVQLSTMVGALTLARATRGDAISKEILESVREFLLRADEPRK